MKKVALIILALLAIMLAVILMESRDKDKEVGRVTEAPTITSYISADNTEKDSNISNMIVEALEKALINEEYDSMSKLCIGECNTERIEVFNKNVGNISSVLSYRMYSPEEYNSDGIKKLIVCVKAMTGSRVISADFTFHINKDNSGIEDIEIEW